MLRWMLFFMGLTSLVWAQPFTAADSLRGNYGRYRANNDLLHYDLELRIDPKIQAIAGKNTIRFKMLKADNKIQLDLYANMALQKVFYKGVPMPFERQGNTFWVRFYEMLPAGSVQEVEVVYGGQPKATSRFGGFKFDHDPDGNDWVFTAGEDVGAMVWWPNKEQWRDEPDSMRLRFTVPKNLVAVSNGRLAGTTPIGDDWMQYDWRVSYPINNYNVSVNVGKYTHFSDQYHDLRLDYYVLTPNLEKAKIQFAQVKPMMGCFEKHFGPYPFKRDGYKLVEVPYAGMEHQSAVAYGNRWANGYLERDWTGVGISPRFDFIIIHESGHEWFGNAVSAAEQADMWIHEATDTYAESAYVECLWGYQDALRYISGYAPKVANDRPIIGYYGVAKAGSGGDMYFKGTLMFNTLRHVVHNDALWWKIWRDYVPTFYLKNITATDFITYFNRKSRQNLTPIFDQYLRYTNIPKLEVRYRASGVQYRWVTDVKPFNMPLVVNVKGKDRRLYPTQTWKTLPGIQKGEFEPRTDQFYIRVAEVNP